MISDVSSAPVVVNVLDVSDAGKGLFVVGCRRIFTRNATDRP